ncbi:MAG: S-methyl-5-thioribose-1-phosphate isomerase, partial [Myxococcales bacterium]
MEPLHPVKFEYGALLLLDQRLLPDEERWVRYTDPLEVAKAITAMVVRGAPAIGIAAAYAMVLAAQHAKDEPDEVRRAVLAFMAGALKVARPTAVNLAWA